MTLDPKKRDGFEPRDAKFLDIIDRCGWHVMSVAPRVGEGGDVFSYSTGLFLRFNHPEIMVCGLDSNPSVAIINEIGRKVQAGGTFGSDQSYSDIFADDVKCRFRPVQIAYYGEYVCWSQWFYEGTDFPVLQCFWPDRKGQFPWENECHPEVVKAQPRLFLPPQSVM